jgi:hypothetical protein
MARGEVPVNSPQVTNHNGVPTGAKVWPPHCIAGDTIEFGGEVLNVTGSCTPSMEEVRGVAMEGKIHKFLTRIERMSHTSAASEARSLEYQFTKSTPPISPRLLLLLCPL